jgi:UDP-3-O-[3-hydroxymyristoyl] glucosamine N-acyltransferase
MKARQSTLSSKEIHRILGGELIGSGDFLVSGVSTLESPEANTIAFYRGTSPKKLQSLLDALPPMLLLVSFTPSLPDNHRGCVLVNENPQKSFIRMLEAFYDSEVVEPSIHPTATIHPSVKLDKSVYIGPHVIVDADVELATGVQIHGNTHLYRAAQIGENSIIYSGVQIREECTIGANCVIHSNSVIGADGFGYLPSKSIGLQKVPQVGTVIIEDSVEIGALTSIDRATVGATRIGQGTKIDNQVQIGHNAQIGRYCIICAQVGIAGSAILGDGVVLGGGVGVADHVTISGGIRVGGHSGVTASLSVPGDYMGMPAVKASVYKRTQILLRRLLADRSRSTN